MPVRTMIVLPGGGYAAHAPHEAEPVGHWPGQIDVPASVFRYPLDVRRPAPLDAVRPEIGRHGGESGAHRAHQVLRESRPRQAGRPGSRSRADQTSSSPSSATPSPR